MEEETRKASKRHLVALMQTGHSRPRSRSTSWHSGEPIHRLPLAPARPLLGEPDVAIRPAKARGEGELGDGAHCGPDRSRAEPQQADTGNHGSDKGGQVRPPSITLHVVSSLVYDSKQLLRNDPYRTGQLTVILNCWEACTPVLSVTVSVNVKVPFVVGVPLIVVPPFDPLTTARPGGSCPAVIDQL